MISGARQLLKRPRYLLLLAGLTAGNFVSCSSTPARSPGVSHVTPSGQPTAEMREKDQPGTTGSKPSACIKFEKGSGRAAKPLRKTAKLPLASREVPAGREKQLQAENEVQARLESDRPKP
jgi:hypothetical protein